MTRLFTAAAAAIVAFGTAHGAMAQEATTFDFDYSGDGAAFEDFNASFDKWGAYDRWDADRDGTLSREEYNRGVFDLYDANRDATLTEDEIATMQEDRLFADETVTSGGAATETQD